MVEQFGNRVLYNKYVLYFLVFITFFHLVGSALLGDYMIPVVFGLVAFVTSFFCKNMTVVLTIGLVVSHIVRYGIQEMRVEEGMSDKTQNGETEPESEMKTESDMKTETPTTNTTTNTPTTKTPTNTDSSGNMTSSGGLDEDKKKKVMDMLSKIAINKKTSDVNGLNDQYKDLIGLQGEIMDNVDALEAKVLKAQEIFTTVKENMKNHLP